MIDDFLYIEEQNKVPRLHTSLSLGKGTVQRLNGDGVIEEVPYDMNAILREANRHIEEAFNQQSGFFAFKKK